MPEYCLDKCLRFKRSFRLLNKRDFQAVFDHATKLNSRYVRLFYSPNNTSNARLGLIISKKIIPLAIARNRIRRVMRESFRHQKEILKGLDIVAIIRSECNPRPSRRSQRDLLRTAKHKVRTQGLSKQALRDDIDLLWQQVSSNLSKPV